MLTSYNILVLLIIKKICKLVPRCELCGTPLVSIHISEGDDFILTLIFFLYIYKHNEFAPVTIFCNYLVMNLR